MQRPGKLKQHPQTPLFDSLWKDCAFAQKAYSKGDTVSTKAS
jgi:hypothetical protein